MSPINSNSKYDDLYLALGITAEQIAKKRVLVNSPLKEKITGRPDSTPSLSLDLDRGLFYDFSHYEGQKLKGGTFDMLAGALGVSIFEPTTDTQAAILYAESIIAKNQNRDEVEALIKRHKPTWDAEYILDSPFVGYAELESALIFHYISTTTSGEHCSARLSTKSMSYSFAKHDDGRRIRKIRLPDENRTNDAFCIETHDSTATMRINAISQFSFAKERKTLYLVEGESDAVTLASLVDAGAVIISYKNVIIPRIPGISDIIVFADRGAETLARTTAERVATAYNFPAKLVTLPKNRENNYDISDYLAEFDTEERTIKLDELIYAHEIITPLDDDMRKAFFFAIGEDNALEMYREQLIRMLKPYALSNEGALDGRRANRFEMQGSDETFILSTADTFEGIISGRKETHELNVLALPCYEMQSDMCKNCQINSVRTKLSRNEDGSDTNRKWVRGEGEHRALEIQLGIFPGSTLNDAHMSTSYEWRKSYQNLFGMECSYQTRPRKSMRSKMELTILQGEAEQATRPIVFLFDSDSDATQKLLGRRLRFLGYWHETTFYCVSVEVIENYDEALQKDSSPEMLQLYVEEQLDLVDSAIGEIKRTPRHFTIHFLAAALSGYKMGSKYMGSNVLFLGDPNIGKSYYVKGLNELLKLGGLLSWSSIKPTDFKFSAYAGADKAVNSANNPPVVVNNGFYLGIDDYQGIKNALSFEHLDGWSMNGTLKASGIMARSTFGSADVSASAPLIILGNLRSNAADTDGIYAMQTFSGNLDAADANAVAKRFGIVIVSQKETKTTRGEATVSSLEKTKVTSKLLGWFYMKNASPMEIDDFTLSMISQYVKHDEGDARRMLSFVNMVRLMVLSPKATSTHVMVAQRLLEKYPFAKVRFDKSKRDTKYYWGLYHVVGTPFAKAMEETILGKLTSIIFKCITFRSGAYHIQTGQLHKALDPNGTYKNARTFFGIEEDDIMHDDDIVILPKSAMRSMKIYLKEQLSIEV